MYYSEIGKIIEAGLERDKDKVASFAQLLAKKMAADGEEREISESSGSRESTPRRESTGFPTAS